VGNAHADEEDEDGDVAPPRCYRARTQVRDHDGVIRDVERTGPCGVPELGLSACDLR
jgi:hypothetical protein